MMYIGKVEIIFFIFVILPFLVGIFFFLRSLNKKKSIGCGFSCLIAGLLPVILIWLFLRGFGHETKRSFIHEFERDTKLTFPQSGKIVEKDYASSYFDYHRAGIIAMDTLEYNKLLSDVQSKEYFQLADTIEKSSRKLKKQFPDHECAYLFIIRKSALWFHKNRQIVVYEHDSENSYNMKKTNNLAPSKKYGIMEHEIFYKSNITENAVDSIADALTETNFFDDKETKRISILKMNNIYEVLVKGIENNHEALQSLCEMQQLLKNYEIEVYIVGTGSVMKLSDNCLPITPDFQR